MPRIAIIGSGSWGTAMATLGARANAHVTLWGRDPEKTAALASHRHHGQLGGAEIPAGVHITSRIEHCQEAELLFWAVPVQHTRATARRLQAVLPPEVPVISLAKGIELETFHRPTEILAQELPGRPVGSLSGPSIAREVAHDLPCCLVMAGAAELCTQVLSQLHGRTLRLYTSQDLRGVELGGALKNVVAIAAGISEGLGFGDNSKAAIITRGLAEMRRLGRAMGAQDGTFAGMAGVGDLLTTCYSGYSRNRALGLAIARGENPLEILHRSHTVAEGAWTSRAAVELGRRHHVELPIASQVASVIWDATPVPRAMELLLARAPKEEDA